MSISLTAPAEKPAEHVDGRIVALVFEVSRHLAITIDRRVAPFNVTGQQAALLVRASVEPGLTLTQLAPWLGTDNAGITRLVDRLEAKGLATRRASASDRRAVVVEPTAAGRDLVPHLMAAFDEVTALLLQGFDADDLSRAESLLRRLRGNIEACESESCPHGQASQGPRGPDSEAL